MQVHHNQRSAIRAHGEKPGMPQGNLAGIAHKDIEANRQNNVNQNDVDQVNIIRRQIKG